MQQQATPFQAGVLIFNNSLTKDPSKRIRILPRASASTQHLACNLDDLLKETTELRDFCAGQGSTIQRKVERILVAVNKNASVIDVLIQQQPDITAVVWGSIRFLIGVAVREIDTSERIGLDLVEIVESLGHWTRYIDLFEESDRVRNVASHLFSQILNFLIRARIYYQKPRARRHLKVGFTTYAQKLDDIMRILRRHAVRLESEAGLASEIKQDDDRKLFAEQRKIDNNEIAEQVRFRKETSTTLEENTMFIQQGILRRESDDATKWLRQWDTFDRFQIAPNAEKGTCTWIACSEAYTRWGSNSYDKPLCIFGPPGCGKSVIARHLISMAKTSITVAHFFQKVTNRDQARPSPFAAAVLADFLQSHVVKSTPQYVRAVQRVVALSKNLKTMDASSSFLGIWSILLDLVKDLPDFTLIVDGLDECDENSRNELCMELVKLSVHQNARVVVLFRHNSKLESSFEDAVKIEITSRMVSKDISLFVNRQIQRYPRELQRCQKDIDDRIVDSFHGIFLLADMMMRCLRSAATYNDQLAYLSNPPTTLNNFYESLCAHTTAQLTEDCVRRRREIFLVLLRISEAPSYEDLSVILALRIDKSNIDEGDKLIEPETEVLNLCSPLVRISRCRVYLMHESVKDYLLQTSMEMGSIHMTLDESDKFLAEKCLMMLSQEKYRSPNTIAILIRHNVEATADEGQDKGFYRYAATHWYVHLTALTDPEPSLVKQAAQFLDGNEFVSWSEFLFELRGSQGTVLEVQSKLKIWRNHLSGDLKDHLCLENYFTGPYDRVSEIFEKDKGDKTLPYLCLYQLGEFYNLSLRLGEAFEVKKKVAEGLINLLGEKHPLCLMAESTFALEYLGTGQYLEAEAIFGRLAQIQRDVLGEDDPRTYQSLQRQGIAQLWMTNFKEAYMNLQESLAGFMNTVGPEDFRYLLSQQTLACVLEAQGDWSLATLDFERVWKFRVQILGPDNPMAIWSRCAMTSTYRKLRRYDEADKAIGEVIDSRERIIGPKASGTIDAIIQQIVVYRDSGKWDEAMELVDFILDGGLANDWFERVCQVDHLHALLEVDKGKLDSARDILQALVDQAFVIGIKGRNRSLLWVLLDLAAILRRQNKADRALMLFNDLVTGIDSEPSSSSWEEPQGPTELRIAEQALALVRAIRYDDAALLLRENGLRWVRDRDFWIITGGPAADTGCMRGL